MRLDEERARRREVITPMATGPRSAPHGAS